MKPWEHPKYGGMSEESARLSHEAWVRQGMRTLSPTPQPRPPLSDSEIERIQLCIEDMVHEYDLALKAAAAWSIDWKQRRPKGFRRANQGKTA